MQGIDRLAQLAVESKKVVVLSGAAATSKSGVSDFPRPDGVRSY